ncbi:(Fe-S)-binding protein [Shouchella sp. 1P09AA]|uniref:(Fe-S)-binding protein n=1 Tax=unclassified Shouchella TaxID=2893065 RepID=UPI0039A22872
MAKWAYEETFDCVQCGYCLPACPTYQTMGKETHSPRGRINLVKMAAEGKIEARALKEPIELCLGCRACESACPTNVKYGRILDSAKEVLAEEQQQSVAKKTVETLIFRAVLPSHSVLRTAGFGLRFYQKSGLQNMMQKSRLLSMFLPESLAEFEMILPKVKKAQRNNKIMQKTNNPMYKVAYFTGCLMDTMFAEINDQAIMLLEKVGCRVEVISGQGCCGALQHHAGDLHTAKELAKQNILAFEKGEFDFIVSSIGGCGAMLMEYDELFREDETWRKRGEAFSIKHVDVSLLLVKCGFKSTRAIDQTAVYQPSCHMTHVQKNRTAPLTLIQSIPGLTYKEVPKQEMCCGSAGIYNLLHYKEATDILDMKMPHVTNVKPDIIITTNPGCHLQMKLGVKRAKLSKQIEVKHLVEVLALSVEEETASV